MEESENFSKEEMKEFMDILESMDESTDDLNYDLISEMFGLNIPELETDMENYVQKIDLGFVNSNNSITDPQYAYESDSGFDLRSTDEVWVPANGRTLIPTGLHFDIPDGYEIQVRSKSGLALNQGLFVLNSPGTVDQKYSGEIKIILFNTTNERIKIQKGQKIAQAVLSPVVSGKWVNLVKVKSIESEERKNNGFGSTGL